MKWNKKIFFVFGSIAFFAAGCSGHALQQPAVSLTPIEPSHVQTPKPVTASYETVSGKKPQFVMLAFDGSYSLDMWQKTLDFARDMALQGQSVHFTYFLSGVYFLNYRKADRYIPPVGKPGTSLIGFANSNNEIEKRVAYVNRAIAEGHEIGSHLNGHFDGSSWSAAQWQQEFDSFKNLIFNIAGNNDVSSADASRFTINESPQDMVGFRAPDLGKNNVLYPVLKKNGYSYDTSAAGKPDTWPQQLPNGIWEFPLGNIAYASSTSHILSMDYNFYFKQSAAKDVAVQGTVTWQKFYDDTYNSFMNYFNANYEGGRAPVQIASHFSPWNDGVYWAAMRDFANNVCGKPEVFCVSFKDLEKYLESQSH